MFNKTASKVIFAFSAVTCFAATGIRIYQVLYQTDYETGFLIHTKSNSAYIFYAVMVIGLLVTASFYFLIRKKDVKITYPHDKKLSGFSFAVAVFFFFDFLHQALNCYRYIEKSESTQLNVLIVMGLVGIAALVSCFYFITYGIANSSSDYNFKNFGYLYLMPSAWAFCRLLTLLIDVISVKFAVDTVVEVIYLIFAILFFGLFAICIDSTNNEKNYKVLTVISFCLLISGVVLTVPNFVSLCSGNTYILTTGTRSNVTDFAISIFTGYFAFDTIIKLKHTENKNCF